MVTKITCGYVMQIFDTETKKWVGQQFIDGDECHYESSNGDPVDPSLFCGDDGKEVYLSLEMKQPEEL